jgi:hypothetical protein
MEITYRKMRKSARDMQDEEEGFEDVDDIRDLREIRHRGRHRALKNIEEREKLRLKLEGAGLLERAQDGTFFLLSGYMADPSDPEQLIPISNEVRQSVKAGIDSALKLLNKILPDLRQVELSQKSEKDADAILNDIELENRLRIYTEAKAGLRQIKLVDDE